MGSGGGEMGENTDCTCGGQEFIAQHLLGSSQPSLVSEDMIDALF